MAIDKPFFTTTPLRQNFDSVIQMLNEAPVLAEELDPQVPPNKLFGYYNGVTNGVQLYVSDSSGRFYIRVK